MRSSEWRAVSGVAYAPSMSWLFNELLKRVAPGCIARHIRMQTRPRCRIIIIITITITIIITIISITITIIITITITIIIIIIVATP